MTRGPAMPPRKAPKTGPGTVVTQPQAEEQRITAVLRGLRGLQEKVRRLRRDGAL